MPIENSELKSEYLYIAQIDWGNSAAESTAITGIDLNIESIAEVRPS